MAQPKASTASALLDEQEQLAKTKNERRYKLGNPTHYRHLSMGRRIVIKAMIDSGLSYRKIANLEGVSLASIFDISKDDEIKELAPEILGKTKKMLAGRAYVLADRSISKAGQEDRLDKMNSYQLSLIGSMMIDKARLMDGASTENIALHSISEHLENGSKDLDSMKDMIIKRFKIMSENDSSTENGENRVLE